MRFFTLAGAMTALMLSASPSHAQQPGPATTAGPGRITCKTATACVLGIGDPATIKYRINVEALPAADKDRLAKQCKPNGKTPCVATVQGNEMSDPLRVKAAKITWYN